MARGEIGIGYPENSGDVARFVYSDYSIALEYGGLSMKLAAAQVKKLPAFMTNIGLYSPAVLHVSKDEESSRYHCTILTPESLGYEEHDESARMHSIQYVIDSLSRYEKLGVLESFLDMAALQSADADWNNTRLNIEVLVASISTIACLYLIFLEHGIESPALLNVLLTIFVTLGVGSAVSTFIGSQLTHSIASENRNRKVRFDEDLDRAKRARYTLRN